MVDTLSEIHEDAVISVYICINNDFGYVNGFVFGIKLGHKNEFYLLPMAITDININHIVLMNFWPNRTMTYFVCVFMCMWICVFESVFFIIYTKILKNRK